MSSQLYIGEKNALTFPVMCDGYLRIDYSDEIANEPYGIFEHEDSFTVEAIITPFDINGNGYKLAGNNSHMGVHGVTTSIKTMPTVQEYNTTDSHYQSHKYRPEANRITDKMVLFQNSNVQLFLQNDTLTTHNQPAEYKLGMTINAVGSDTLMTDSTVINSSLRHVSRDLGYCLTGEHTASAACASAHANMWKVPAFYGPDGSVKYERALADVSSSGHGGSSATFTHDGSAHADDHFWVGQELFTLSGQIFTSIGKITGVNSANKTVTLAASVTANLNSEALYTHAQREALYLINSFHIACAFDVNNGRMTIYLNGDMVATKIHSGFGAGDFPFYIAAEDTYIGQDPSAGISTQFAGAIHEFAILNQYKTEFNTLFTLAPNYRDVLLYYRFEEVDE